MKKLIVLFAFIVFTASTYGQAVSKLKSAIIDFRKPNYVTAKAYIDEATELGVSDMSEKNLSKYYFYLGQIYYRIHVSEDSTISALDPNNEALDIATKALQDLIAHEKQSGKQRNSEEGLNILRYCASGYGSRAYEHIGAQDFAAASKDFFKSYQLKLMEGISYTDTASLFNAALMANNAELYEDAINYYNMLIDLDYQGIVHTAVNVSTGEREEFDNKKVFDNAIATGTHNEPSSKVTGADNLYILLSNVYKTQGNTEKANEVIKKGRAKYPNSNSLIVEEFNYYLNAKKYKEASDNLALAIQQDPNNSIYYSIQGNLYYNHLDKKAEAVDILKKAIEVDANNKDANYMLGYIEVEKSNDIIREMDKLSLSQQKKYNELDKKQKDHLRAALPYLEKAYEVDPDDISTVEALKTVYYQLKNMEKNKEMIKRLAELNAQ